MAQSDQELRELVDTFVSQLSDLVRRSAAEMVMAALASPNGAARGGKGRASAPRGRPSAGRGGRRIRRSESEIESLLSKVTAYVDAHPESRAEDIKKGLGLSAAATGDALRRLISSKKLKRKGQKRSSTYTTG